MKKNSLLLVYIFPSLFSMAQYKVIDSKSSVKFTIKNFGISVGGTFTGLEGNILFDPKDPTNSTFRVSVDAGSVNTDNNLRDSHLKGESYFNTAQYARIFFQSSKITTAPNTSTLVLNGKITIKNHTQEVSFPFTAEPSSDGWLFKGSFTINRRDFEVGGFSTISDNAQIALNVFADK